MDGEKNRIISQYHKISEYNKEKILKVSRVRVGGAEERLGVGASGKEEKGEPPTSCFLLSLRPSAPLPPPTSIFFGC